MLTHGWHHLMFLRPQCSRQRMTVAFLSASSSQLRVCPAVMSAPQLPLACRWDLSVVCRVPGSELRLLVWSWSRGWVGRKLFLAIDSHLRGVFPCVLTLLFVLRKRSSLGLPVWTLSLPLGFQEAKFCLPHRSRHQGPVGTEKAFSREPTGTAYLSPWRY